jgi:hypothetical protein
MLGTILIKGKLYEGKTIIYEESCMILLMHKVVLLMDHKLIHVMDVFEHSMNDNKNRNASRKLQQVTTKLKLRAIFLVHITVD